MRPWMFTPVTPRVLTFLESQPTPEPRITLFPAAGSTTDTSSLRHLSNWCPFVQLLHCHRLSMFLSRRVKRCALPISVSSRSRASAGTVMLQQVLLKVTVAINMIKILIPLYFHPTLTLDEDLHQRRSTLGSTEAAVFASDCRVVSWTFPRMNSCRSLRTWNLRRISIDVSNMSAAVS
jgi:hypothetical protein